MSPCCVGDCWLPSPLCRVEGYHVDPVRHLVPCILVWFVEPPLLEFCTNLALRRLVSSALISLTFMVITLARSPSTLVFLLVLSPLWIADFFKFRGLLWVVLLLISRGVLLCSPPLLVIL